MILSKFQTITHAKWILAGEHAVLRGHPALVFPILTKTLTLRYEPGAQPCEVTCSGEHGQALRALFWDVMSVAEQRLGFSLLPHLTGHFYIHNIIPLGIGMGASAALCVALARWFEAHHFLKNTQDDVFVFAQQLEHLFHGESSGLDIAGVSHETGLCFQKGIPWTFIPQTWHPQWFLSSSGKTSVTADCIQRVKALWQDNPKEAARIDENMQNSVSIAQQALIQTNISQALKTLKEAITLAANCFEDWGLIDKPLRQHMDSLLAAGALAAKPTGSGRGGYVLSLWPLSPPANHTYISLQTSDPHQS